MTPSARFNGVATVAPRFRTGARVIALAHYGGNLLRQWRDRPARQTPASPQASRVVNKVVATGRRMKGWRDVHNAAFGSLCGLSGVACALRKRVASRIEGEINDRRGNKITHIALANQQPAHHR